MHELVRPLLVNLSRVGLFLAVIAAIVGQWWMISVQGPAFGARLQLRVSDSGWSLLKGRQTVALGNSVSVYLTKITGPTRSWRFGEEESWPRWSDSKQLMPGVVWSEILNDPARSVGIRHWLPITFFGTFYLTLKLIYRRKPEQQNGGEENA